MSYNKPFTHLSDAQWAIIQKSLSKIASLNLEKNSELISNISEIQFYM